VKKRRNFVREMGERRYKRLFVIATEGEKTEPQYFSLFNDRQAIVKIMCLNRQKGSAPLRVKKSMEDYLIAKKMDFRPDDEAWLVVDKDNWQDDHLRQLYEWANQKSNYGLALSNPCFEYWILLHFEDAKGVSSSKDCRKKLQQYLPNYDKGIPSGKFTPYMISDAIQRASNRDQTQDAPWPQSAGSTVYKLVQNIQKAQ